MLNAARPVKSRSAALLTEDDLLIGAANKIRFYPMVAESASGSTIIDPDGGTYLDFAAGWAVANTGYCHPTVVSAIREQAERLSFAGMSTVTHRAAIEFAHKLIDVTPLRGPRKVGFGLSGSDACEGVSKLLPIARGRPKMITFLGGMHGMTAASAGLSGLPGLSRFPSSTHVTHVPYPNPYRPALGDAATCGREAVRFIEEQIFSTVSPPELTAGILVEPIQSDSGVIVPPDDFLPGLRDLCDRYGLLLVVDEVKIGVGRTGRMWGCELTDTIPDVLVTGKGIASGLPMSAIVAPPEVLDVVAAGHAFTTAGSPLACAAGSATLAVVQDERLADNATEQGSYLMGRLVELQATHPLIGDVRGRGLMIGVELVRSRETKHAAKRECAKLALRCFQLGLLIHYVGLFSNVVEITPPLVLTRTEAERGMDIFAQALKDVEDGRVSDEEVVAYAGW